MRQRLSWLLSHLLAALFGAMTRFYLYPLLLLSRQPPSVPSLACLPLTPAAPAVCPPCAHCPLPAVLPPPLSPPSPYSPPCPAPAPPCHVNGSCPTSIAAAPWSGPCRGAAGVVLERPAFEPFAATPHSVRNLQRADELEALLVHGEGHTPRETNTRRFG